jgi:hypothetical protein
MLSAATYLVRKSISGENIILDLFLSDQITICPVLIEKLLAVVKCMPKVLEHKIMD